MLDVRRAAYARTVARLERRFAHKAPRTLRGKVPPAERRRRDVAPAAANAVADVEVCQQVIGASCFEFRPSPCKCCVMFAARGSKSLKKSLSFPARERLRVYYPE